MRGSGAGKSPGILHALRSLRRGPGHAVTVTATVALGIGADVAMFTVFNGVLLRRLPYRDPERMVVVSGRARSTPCGTRPATVP